jgi:hypothetical protein
VITSNKLCDERLTKQPGILSRQGSLKGQSKENSYRLSTPQGVEVKEKAIGNAIDWRAFMSGSTRR